MRRSPAAAAVPGRHTRRHPAARRSHGREPGTGPASPGAGLWILRAGDLLLTAAGQPVEKAQDLQRLMFADAIGKPFAITVMRNGALVDVIAQPSELVAA